MSFSHGRNARFLAGGFDLSDATKTVTVTGSADLVDNTGFQNTSRRYLAGYKEATVKASGFYRGTINSDQPAISTDLHGSESFAAGTICFSHYPAGATIGNRGWAVAANETVFNLDTQDTEVAAYDLEATSSVGAEPVVSHYAIGTAVLTSLTGSGTATSVDNAAASTNGGAAYFHSFRLTGGTAVLKIQHSTDDSTYVDLASGTVVAATNERVSSRVALAGTINRYTRAVYTVTGGSACFHAGLSRA